MAQDSQLGSSEEAHRLFVTRIAPQITQKDVAAHFQQFGVLTDVYLPFIPGRPGHKGFAFVSFVDKESIKGALAVDHHVIKGAEVVVDVAKAPAQEKSTRKEGQQNRIFVTRLPEKITQAEVQRHFEQYGEITDCHMPANHQTPGGHKGFAFISYADAASVKAATEVQQEIHGSTVVVDVAATRGTMYGGLDLPRFVPGRLFVTRMHQEITKADLEAFFGQYGELDDVYAQFQGQQRIAFVQFKDPAVAKQLVDQYAQQTLEVRPGVCLVVDQAKAKPRFQGEGRKYWQPWTNTQMVYPGPMAAQPCGQFWGQGYVPNFQGVYQHQAAPSQGFMRWNPY